MRSIATSRAFQVGARSSSSASSASSTNDHTREVGHGRPHRGPAADHDARAGTGAVPGRGELSRAAVGAQAHHLAPVRLEDGDETTRRGRCRDRSRCSSPPARPGATRDRRGRHRVGRSSAESRAPRTRRVDGGLELRFGVDRYDVGRRRAAEERCQRPGPSPRTPTTQVDDVDRRPRRDDRDQRAQARPVDLGRVDVGHRAPSRARGDHGAGRARSCRPARRAPMRREARSRTRGGLRERRAERARRTRSPRSLLRSLQSVARCRRLHADLRPLAPRSRRRYARPWPPGRARRRGRCAPT